MWPWRPGGRPSSCASQSSVTSSSSCSAGEVRQRIPIWFRPAMSSSARIPGSEAVLAEIREEARALPVREAGMSTSSRSRRTAANGSACSGGDAGSRARISPGLDLRQHRQLAHALEIGGDPVDAAASAKPRSDAMKLDVGASFSISASTARVFRI